MFTELPTAIATILAADQAPDAIFTALMPALCETLNCDRCFLYLRNPTTGAGQITHCCGNSPRWADLTGANWIEAADVAEKDPLMAIAFRTPEAVFVEDIASSHLICQHQKRHSHRTIKRIRRGITRSVNC